MEGVAPLDPAVSLGAMDRGGVWGNGERMKTPHRQAYESTTVCSWRLSPQWWASCPQGDSGGRMILHFG